jgi:hypothetical protein
MAVEQRSEDLAAEKSAQITAENLNRILRELRYTTEPSDGPTGIDGQRFTDERRRQTWLLHLANELSAASGLSQTATVSDWPRIGHLLARMPVLGGLLAFLREVYGSLWIKAHRRSPLGQQIAVNHLTYAAIQELGHYIEHLDHISAEQDREFQAWKKEVALLRDDLLDLRERIDALKEAS